MDQDGFHLDSIEYSQNVADEKYCEKLSILMPSARRRGYFTRSWLADRLPDQKVTHLYSYYRDLRYRWSNVRHKDVCPTRIEWRI